MNNGSISLEIMCSLFLCIRFQLIEMNSKLELQQSDDVYIYSANNDYIANPKQMQGYWIPKEKVEVESVLSTGRMMVVSKAYLTDGNLRNVVAVKALKSNLVCLCPQSFNF